MARTTSPLLAATLWLTLPACLPAQSTGFDPFPPGTEVLYRFDLPRTMFPSPEAERAERATALALASRAAALIPSAGSSAKSLLAMLRTADSADLKLARHYAYFTLRSEIDRRDETSMRESGALYAAARQWLGRVDSVLASLTDARFDRLRRIEPALAPYAFAVTRARAQAAPAIAASDQSRVPQWLQIIRSGPVRFQETMREVDLGTVATPEGTLDVRTNIVRLLSHPDRSVREAFHRRNNAGLATRRDTFADILTSVARARNALAKAQGFADYREQSYRERYLTVENVHDVLSALRTAATEAKEYERFRAARIRQQFGYASVHWWDRMAPIPGRSAPRFRIDQATTIALDAARPLGATYVAELGALLDPRNGRIDVAPGPFKADRPGFATGLVGYPSHFFQGRYSGFVDDVVIMVHEAGHAAQNMMMDRRGVLPRYASGPGYFTESYAAFSELLALEHLAQSTSDTALRIYYMERLVDQAFGVFRNGFEAMFEDSLYALVAAGQAPTADDLEVLHHSIGSQFSSWYGAGSDVTLGWAQPHPFYVRPLYHMNYVLASLIALNYMQQLKKDPASFQRRYQSLLSRGYDATPDDLLEQEMGIEFGESQRLITTAMGMLRQWRQELARLTQQPRAS